MEGFPSGQREQTVNLSSMTSVVRIHHLPPKQKDIPKGMSFFCFGGRWLWIRKVALRNSPVGCFNHRGFAAAKRIHHRTGRHACGSATMGGNSQSRQARAQSESQTSAPVSSLDKTGASVYNTDIRTALTCQVRSFPVASLELEENAAAFLGGGYFLRFKIPKTTVASSIRSVSTSIVVMRVTPLFRGNNLAVPYQ